MDRRAASVLLAGQLVALTACNSRPPTDERPMAERTPPGAFQESDLPGILLQAEEAPSGVSFEPSGSGVADSYLESQLRQPGQEWPPEGFKTSFQHFFSMPPLSEPESETFPVKKVRGVISLAVLFDSPERASQFLQGGFPSDWQLDVAGFETLGEERRGLVTESTGGLFIDESKRPRRTTIIWRRANLFLQMNVSGQYSLDQVIALAHLVDARAKAGLSD
jgi:hypothetical protein